MIARVVFLMKVEEYSIDNKLNENSMEGSRQQFYRSRVPGVKFGSISAF